MSIAFRHLPEASVVFNMFRMRVMQTAPSIVDNDVHLPTATNLHR